MGPKAKMQTQRLIAQRDQLLAEMEALRNKIAGLELAISLLNSDIVDGEMGSEKINVKTTILDLLREAGTTGLNAQTAVEVGSRRGVKLDRGSVSSLLSRLKREGTLVYEDDRYKLKEFVQRAERPTITIVATPKVGHS
jgi:hypothetical protein